MKGDTVAERPKALLMRGNERKRQIPGSTAPPVLARTILKTNLMQSRVQVLEVHCWVNSR